MGYAFQQRNHRKMMHLSEKAILVREEGGIIYTAVVALTQYYDCCYYCTVAMYRAFYFHTSMCSEFIVYTTG